MRPFALLCMLFGIVQNANAQNFSFTGQGHEISELHNNPAFAVTDDAAQIHFLRISTAINSNAYNFRTKALVSNTSEMKKGVDYFKMRDKADKSVWANVDIAGPAASFVVKKQHYFAVSTRMRTMLNTNNLNNSIFQLIDNRIVEDSNLYNYIIEDFNLTYQVFSEANITYAGYVYYNEEHSLKGGATLKLLFGSGAAGMSIPNTGFRLWDNDHYGSLYGNARIAYTPYANTWLSAGALNAFKKSFDFGVGADLGLIYEYHPIDYNNKNPLPYAFRAGISLTDLGGINYTASNSSGKYILQADTQSTGKLQIDPNETFGLYLNRLERDSVLISTERESDFRMGLPTALRMFGDVYLTNHLALNTAILLNLRGSAKRKFSTQYVSTLLITPRYQFNKVTVSLPFYYNSRGQGNFGLGIGIGGFYAGTNTLLSTFSAGTITALDGYIGFACRIKAKEEKRY